MGCNTLHGKLCNLQLTPSSVKLYEVFILNICKYRRSIKNKLAKYRKSLHHIHRMEDIRCPKQLLDYQTTGKRPE
jgi:hypothetical protein